MLPQQCLDCSHQSVPKCLYLYFQGLSGELWNHQNTLVGKIKEKTPLLTTEWQCNKTKGYTLMSQKLFRLRTSADPPYFLHLAWLKPQVSFTRFYSSLQELAVFGSKTLPGETERETWPPATWLSATNQPACGQPGAMSRTCSAGVLTRPQCPS